MDKNFTQFLENKLTFSPEDIPIVHQVTLTQRQVDPRRRALAINNLITNQSSQNNNGASYCLSRRDREENVVLLQSYIAQSSDNNTLVGYGIMDDGVQTQVTLAATQIDTQHLQLENINQIQEQIEENIQQDEQGFVFEAFSYHQVEFYQNEDHHSNRYQYNPSSSSSSTATVNSLSQPNSSDSASFNCKAKQISHVDNSYNQSNDLQKSQLSTNNSSSEVLSNSLPPQPQFDHRTSSHSIQINKKVKGYYEQSHLILMKEMDDKLKKLTFEEVNTTRDHYFDFFRELCFQKGKPQELTIKLILKGKRCSFPGEILKSLYLNIDDKESFLESYYKIILMRTRKAKNVPNEKQYINIAGSHLFRALNQKRNLIIHINMNQFY